MHENSKALNGIYRCPICGHRDSAEVSAHGSSLRIACSYCENELEVSARNPAAVLLSAQVADQPLRR